MDRSFFMYSSCTSAMYYLYVSHKSIVRALGMYSTLASIVVLGYWSYRLFNNLQDA